MDIEVAFPRIAAVAKRRAPIEIIGYYCICIDESTALSVLTDNTKRGQVACDCSPVASVYFSLCKTCGQSAFEKTKKDKEERNMIVHATVVCSSGYANQQKEDTFMIFYTTDRLVYY